MPVTAVDGRWGRGVYSREEKRELPLTLGIFRQVNDVFLFLNTAYAAWKSVYVSVNRGYLLGELFISASLNSEAFLHFFFFLFNEHVIKKHVFT